MTLSGVETIVVPGTVDAVIAVVTTPVRGSRPFTVTEYVSDPPGAPGVLVTTYEPAGGPTIWPPPVPVVFSAPVVRPASGSPAFPMVLDAKA